MLAALASPPATKALDPDPFSRRSLRHAVYAALLHFGLETADFSRRREFKFSTGMSLPENIDALSPAELKLLVVKLLEEVADLRRTVAAQRDEIARLKGGAPRPNIKPNSKPSGMEQATDPKPPGSSSERRRRGTRGRR